VRAESSARIARPDRLVDPSLSTERLAAELEGSITRLAGRIGERHIWLLDRLREAEEWLAATLADHGYAPRREEFLARGITVANLIAERRGSSRPDEIVVVGAHYDSRCGMRRRHGRVPDDGIPGTPGANDNASGIAATLALARVFADRRPARTIRFVAFVNEEPPFFRTAEMGSLVHALGCRERGERIVGMFTPETLGYYTDEPGTQRLAPVFGRAANAPGDFVAFLGSWRSRRLIEAMLAGFRAATDFPVVGLPVPRLAPRVAWSDDWSFWKAGYPGVTVTDTAYLRYRHYHTPEDTPEKLDYPRMARVVAGLAAMLEGLAGPELPG
jgi:Zn-dependent M28 family amino/carboxypeptidase